MKPLNPYEHGDSPCACICMGGVRPGCNQRRGAGVRDAPGGVRDAPGGVRDAPGGVRDAPGGVRDAPGGVRDAPGA